MAAPHVFIWWDEFDRRDLPCVCMRCGKKKAKWTKWRFERSVYKNMKNYRRIRKVEIPLCDAHAANRGSSRRAPAPRRTDDRTPSP